MAGRRFNWAIWAGFLLTLFAFVSYPFIFARYPITRDFPWANLLLFAAGLVLVIIGVRRAYTPGRTLISKIGSSFAAALSVVMLSFFLFLIFGMTRHLPASRGAPQVGQKVPAFTLMNQSGKPVSLAEVLSSPVNGTPPKGALIIFYRGYW
jgi:hypothetical protein